MTNAASYGSQFGQSHNRRRHGLGWVPWVALALLAAIILGSYLITRNATDVGDRSGVDLTNDPTAQAAAPARNNANAGNANAGRTGVFTAGGSDVLDGANTAGLVGQQASANNVTVRSVVANEGFWISSNGSEQLFVYLTPQARGTGESAAQVRAGQRVNVGGTLTRIPSNVGALGVDDSEGAAQLRSEGIYLDATTFRIR